MASKQAKQFLHAVKEGRDDKVEKLLKKYGAQVAYDVYDEAGYSPLTFAALLGQSKILRFMMMAQVDLNQKDLVGRTALYVAALCNRKDVVRALLESETLDIDMACTDIRQTALEAAIERNYSEIVTILGRIAGQWLNEAVKRKELARVTELVLRPGTALDVPDFTGWTPLHIAMKTNQPDIVTVLAKAGANENAANMGGKTPFDVAHEYLGDQAESLIELFKAHKGEGFGGMTSLPSPRKRPKSAIYLREDQAPSQFQIKAAWKHKDGASSQDLDLAAQLQAMRDAARAEGVRVGDAQAMLGKAAHQDVLSRVLAEIPEAARLVKRPTLDLQEAQRRMREKSTSTSLVSPPSTTSPR